MHETNIPPLTNLDHQVQPSESWWCIALTDLHWMKAYTSFEQESKEDHRMKIIEHS